MIRITDPTRCCGCSACMAICPHDAIMMKGDCLGFPYPVVDMERCVDCGLCEKVCGFSELAGTSDDKRNLDIEAYVARHNDGEVLGRSQSGGAFTALSDLILEEGGVIYGAVFDGPGRVCHKRAETAGQRNQMCGSKYVQSDMGDVFRQVRADLKSGRKVMFTGTPCQVAGLKSFLPESLCAGLLLVDFVCHGVPSPAVWSDYVGYMARYGRVKEASFRDKRAGGWKRHVESFVYADGTKRTGETYRILFYKNIMLRHSCAVCPYDVTRRMSDVTIADFWGVDEVFPTLDGDAGTSMVVCNTQQGKALVARASGALEMHSVVLDRDFMERRNPNLLHPARMYKDRMEFEMEYARKGFLHVARRWSDKGIGYRIWQLKHWILTNLNRTKHR